MANIEFSRALKELRQKAGFTQKEVYEHFEIPQSTFSSWEVGKSEPSGEMLLRLCKFYNSDMLKDFNANADALTNNELLVIEKYRELDNYGRNAVKVVMENELKRTKHDAEEKALIARIHELNRTLSAAYERTDLGDLSDEELAELKRLDDEIIDRM